MGYIIKENVAKDIKRKYKCGYIAEETGITQSYLSQILHRKQNISKKLAYFITKTVNSELEIEDLFERI